VGLGNKFDAKMIINEETTGTLMSFDGPFLGLGRGRRGVEEANRPSGILVDVVESVLYERIHHETC
jgi:hypothetical protein